MKTGVIPMLTREIPVMRRGKLDVSLRPPGVWWDGHLQPGVRPATVKLLAALMSEPVVDIDDLIDAMGWDTLNTLRTKITDMRNLLGVLELPIYIVSTRKEGTKRRAVGGFRLEVME